ncbi:MAG: hypothetical protein A2V67_13515 [Deltaproteobacteria bacterium RBG_13_61_14]|nr:MAG: hypothetical protein A2V67_13515 [Deltaproteobacteria bacterium RBG_13_61_14]
MNMFALVRKAKPEEGAALLTAVVILLALTIMGFAMILVTKVDLMVSRNFRVAEEALNASEIGASMCVQVANINKVEMIIDQAYGLFPESTPLKTSDVEAGVGYSHWECLVTKEGLAPGRKRSSLDSADTKVVYYQFRIQSKGLGRAQTQRNIETLIRVKQVQHHGDPGFARIAYRYN